MWLLLPRHPQESSPYGLSSRTLQSPRLSPATSPSGPNSRAGKQSPARLLLTTCSWPCPQSVSGHAGGGGGRGRGAPFESAFSQLETLQGTPLLGTPTSLARRPLPCPVTGRCRVCPPVQEAKGPVVDGEPHNAHVVRVEHAVAEADTLPLSHHPGRATCHLGRTGLVAPSSPLPARLPLPGASCAPLRGPGTDPVMSTSTRPRGEPEETSGGL